MKYGIAMFPTDYAIQADALARELEARGFESLWLPEHTHIPASRKSPWPGGADLPREYWHTLDPFVALGAAAAVTKTLMLGTGICLVIERDPITLAKEVASLDHISRGRVLFGIGGGWNAEEMEHHGTPFAERRDLFLKGRAVEFLGVGQRPGLALEAPRLRLQHLRALEQRHGRLGVAGLVEVLGEAEGRGRQRVLGGR